MPQIVPVEVRGQLEREQSFSFHHEGPWAWTQNIQLTGQASCYLPSHIGCQPSVFLMYLRKKSKMCAHLESILTTPAQKLAFHIRSRVSYLTVQFKANLWFRSTRFSWDCWFRHNLSSADTADSQSTCGLAEAQGRKYSPCLTARPGIWSVQKSPGDGDGQRESLGDHCDGWNHPGAQGPHVSGESRLMVVWRDLGVVTQGLQTWCLHQVLSTPGLQKTMPGSTSQVNLALLVCSVLYHA